MKYKYNTKVKVKSGFYKGLTGVVKQYTTKYEVHLDTDDLKVKFREDELERVLITKGQVGTLLTITIVLLIIYLLKF